MSLVFTAKAKRFAKGFALALALFFVLLITVCSLYSRGAGLLVSILGAFCIMMASFLLILIGSIALGAIVFSFVRRYKERQAEKEAIDQILEIMNRRAEERMAEADAKPKRKAAPAKRRTSAKKTETEQPKKKTTKTKKSK